MDKAGIAIAITSPTTPQVGFLPAPDAARIVHEANEYAKRLMADHPGRFGTFAMLPMPYVDECLKEIEYAFDTLKVDGIGMMTSYGDRWLGYPQFAPMFDEFNRRKSTVSTHPTTANCCVNLVHGVGDATVELGADTTRSIVKIFSGAAQRLWRCQLHLLARRRRADRGGRAAADPDDHHAALQGQIHPRDDGRSAPPLLLRYGAGHNAVTIGALSKLVPVSQIGFGTDYPYRIAAEHVRGLVERFGADEMMENAMRHCVLLLVLLLAACSDDSLTRNFSLSRNSAPETMASTQMPLSTPPSLAMRPTRPGALVPNRGDAQSPEQAAGSTGQDALVQAAGPTASSDIRTVINENSGLVYPDPGFVDRLMGWAPPPGYVPIITQARSGGGWFSRLF